MGNTRLALFRGLLVVLVLVSGVAGSLALAAGGGSQATDDTEYTMEELTRGGTVVDERFASLRRAGTYAAYWVVRYPPSGFNSYGSAKGSKEYLEPSSTIRRGKVRVFSTRFGGAEEAEKFKLVYWVPTEKTVETENGTTSETVPKVLATDTAKLKFDEGFSQYADLPIRSFYDQKVRVTIWMVDNPDVRWTANVKTIATAAPVNIDSKSDLYDWLLLWNVLPSLVVLGLVSKVIPSIRQTAGAGPRRTALLIGGGVFAGLGFMLWGYVSLASLVAAVPLVFPLVTGWVVGAVLLDQDSAVKHIGLMRLNTEGVTSPIDADASVLDALDGEIEGHDVVQMPNGDLAIYESGFKPFLARLKGKYAKLEVANREAEIPMKGDYDELYLVDQESEDLITHVPEKVVFAFPWKTHQVPEDIEDWTAEDRQLSKILPQRLEREHYFKSALVLGAVALAGFGAKELIGTWVWGVVACLPGALIFVRAVEGEGKVYVAPGQARKAYTTAMYLDVTLKRFATIPDLMRALVEAETDDLDVDRWLGRMRDEGLIKQSSDPDSDPFQSGLVEDDPARSDSDRAEATGGAD